MICVHLHVSSLCQVAHKTSISCRQPSLSAAAMHTSFHDLHPALPLSFLTVLLHVILGLPRFRCPSGVHVNAVLQSLSGSFLICVTPWQIVTVAVLGLKVSDHSDAREVRGCDVRGHLGDRKSFTSISLTVCR